MGNRTTIQRLPRTKETSDTTGVELALRVVEVRLPGHTGQRVDFEKPAVEVLVGVDLAPIGYFRRQFRPEHLLSIQRLSLYNALHLGDDATLELGKRPPQVCDLLVPPRHLLASCTAHDLNRLTVLLDVLVSDELCRGHLCGRAGLLGCGKRRDQLFELTETLAQLVVLRPKASGISVVHPLQGAPALLVGLVFVRGAGSSLLSGRRLSCSFACPVGCRGLCGRSLHLHCRVGVQVFVQLGNSLRLPLNLRGNGHLDAPLGCA